MKTKSKSGICALAKTGIKFKKKKMRNLGFQFFTCLIRSEIEKFYYIILIPLYTNSSIYYREAVSGLCERRGFDIDSIEVYLDNNKTPLPLLTSETSWLSGRTLRIKGQFRFSSDLYIYIYVYMGCAYMGY